MTLLLFPGDHTGVHIERLAVYSQSGPSVFIIFGGLPATGKTTLARELARQLGAVYLRIDTIEQAIAPTDVMSVGETGYRVGYAVAEDNLRLGRIVVADSVNPLRITRDAWRNAAKRSRIPPLTMSLRWITPKSRLSLATASGVPPSLAIRSAIVVTCRTASDTGAARHAA